MYNLRAGHRKIIWLGLGLEGVLFALALGLGWLLHTPPLRYLHLRPEHIAAAVVATIPLLLTMWWCSESTWGPFRRLTREIEETLAPLFAGCSAADFALISLMAGVGEEALFRGVIQTATADALGPIAGLALASTLFGLVHFITPTYALLAGLIGVYLGGLVMVFDNLLVAILVHALYDFLALMYWVRRQESR
ncbi:MAG: CPBP family intramembrane metalloprotease [Gemmatimonadales bacterium]|nr:CPBP family intramembrane metalloprotease [Gemmatimonadales bacterium]NIN12508.1 CPBP family intramembrane metalloprotease [Gemmatimonadales bacterium]NIN50879.1 CPBP family intramembrane metalloprotease [Gemmatimonadales bacterium]NIP08343.1 CPBP family intramembrane metalloprotease [Gemmatimonadales bacterium]NIR03440.1 CPBP family intramembrane metalloprotease [Gemmatimonadales bacterium]